MDFTMLVVFVLAGVMLLFVARFIFTNGIAWKVVAIPALCLAAAGASYFSVVWWEGVILGKGGEWAILHYFPQPGTNYAIIIFVCQAAAAEIIYRAIVRLTK
ncbi:MAG: hypothetical protein HY918_05890 [Candidatus Doudnabacteria bacterium]|nr:hypothetical protein [Candidatus Doudnabacteria bacterium]